MSQIAKSRWGKEGDPLLETDMEGLKRLLASGMVNNLGVSGDQ